MTVAILPSKRESWLAARRQHVTATDVSAICGINPWRSPLDVYLDKRGLMEPQPENDAMRMGKRLQPVVLDLYEESTGVPIRRYADDELVVCPSLPWAAATPDAMRVADDFRVVEAKTVGERSAAQWGEPGTDDVPDYYLVQVAWQMLVTGRDLADLAALFGGRNFGIYPIRNVGALQNALVERCGRFWREHVEAGVAPEIGAGESAARYLRQQFPRDTRPDLLPSDERLDVLAARLSELRAAFQRYDVESETVENLIKADIGDAAGIQGNGWRATWKATKDTRNTDWRAAALQMMELLGPDGQQIADAYTTKKPGARRFLFTFKGEE